jgi:beta-carotene/zeaxanthin 4-ketolase
MLHIFTSRAARNKNTMPKHGQCCDPISGILIAISIMTLWASSLIWLLSLDIAHLSTWGITIAVLIRTFLQTGLFITAHDAMHGSVFPTHRQINDGIGAIATLIYAFLPFQPLQHKHRIHHRHPASLDDPDFDASHQDNPLSWYLKFMRGYLNGKQLWILLTGIALFFAILHLSLHIPSRNLILFWLLPMILSSLQLFYFGTFLPHRQPSEGHNNAHRARSSHYPVFWSFVTCYHFGYHWEHHEYPYLPWFRLPASHQATPAKH